MTVANNNGDAPPVLDADTCDVLIAQFRDRIERLQREATEMREEFDRLHRRWLLHVETRNGE
jgi:hypothetical protein